MIKKLLNHPLIKSLSVYTFSTILQRALPFLLIPFITNYLKPEEYGLVETFQSLFLFVFPFIGMTTHGAVTREYYNKDYNFPEFIGNVFYILFGSTLLAGFVIYFFSAYIAKLSLFPESLLWTVVVLSVSMFVLYIVLIIFQVRVKPKAYGILQISNSAFFALLTIFFLAGLKFKHEGWIYSRIIATSTFAFIGFIIIRKSGFVSFKLNKKYIISALLFGIPLIPSQFAKEIADVLIINNIFGLTSTGIFRVAYRISFIIFIIHEAFNRAWTPWMFEILSSDDKKGKRHIVIFSYLYIIALAVLPLLLAAIAIWVPFLYNIFVGEDYRESKQLLIYLVLGNGLLSIYFMTVNYLFYLKKTIQITIASLLSIIIHIISIKLLSSLYGIKGVAYSHIISNIFLGLVTAVFAIKYYKMPWLFWRKS